MRIITALIGSIAAFTVVVYCAFSADANIRMCTVPAMVLVILNARALGIALAER